MLLVKRANETAKTVLPEESILGMIYDAISKDPREEIRRMSSYSSYKEQSLDEFLLTLHKSPHTGPFNSRHVKMNEFKPAIIEYCNHFQEGKCRFGDKCRYEHKINPDYKKKEIVNDDKKRSNIIITNKNNIKFQFKKRTSNLLSILTSDKFLLEMSTYLSMTNTSIRILFNKEIYYSKLLFTTTIRIVGRRFSLSCPKL